MTTRAELAEMGLLDRFLQTCRDRHVLLVDLVGPCRTAGLVRARAELYVWLRALGMTTTEVARIFDRDHTSIITAIRREHARGGCVVPLRPLAKAEPQ